MERCSLRSLKATQTGVGCCLPQVGGFGSHVSSLDSVRFARLTVKGEQAPVWSFWKKMPDVKEKEAQIYANYCLTLELPPALR